MPGLTEWPCCDCQIKVIKYIPFETLACYTLLWLKPTTLLNSQKGYFWVQATTVHCGLATHNIIQSHISHNFLAALHYIPRKVVHICF